MGLKNQMNILGRLKNISAPLLIIWGREDRIVPVSHAHRAARELPEAEVQVFPQCGHWPQMEKAEMFNDLVQRFLAEDLQET